MNDYEDYPDGRVCCMGCQIISGRTPFPHEAGCVVQRAEQAEAERETLTQALFETTKLLAAFRQAHIIAESGTPSTYPNNDEVWDRIAANEDLFKDVDA